MVRRESRVMPGSREPVSSGVTMRSPYTKYRFIPPISSIQRCSTASSQTTWSQPCEAAWACATSEAA